jgi:hypothetical protein
MLITSRGRPSSREIPRITAVRTSSSATCFPSTKESPSTITRGTPGSFCFGISGPRIPWLFQTIGLENSARV